MYTIIEKYGSVYCTDSSNGDILYELTEPAVMFLYTEGSMPVISRLGNKEVVMEEYNSRTEKAKKAGLLDMLSEYYVMDLPLDVEILNKVYNNTGYLMTLLKSMNSNTSAENK